VKREDCMTQAELENRVLRALPAPPHPPINEAEVLRRTGLRGETVQSVLRTLGAAQQVRSSYPKGWHRMVPRPEKLRSRQSQALEMAEAFVEELPFNERYESEIYLCQGQALILTGGEEGVREGRVTVVTYDGTIMEAPVGSWTTLRERGNKVG